MSTSRGTLAPGTTPLRIQKGSSRSPSPAKEPLPTSHPAPYTLKPRKPSNGSAHQEGARRTSSSYSSLRSNSLVSNSPFRGLNGVEPAGPRHRPAPSGFNVYRSGPAPPSARSSLHISSGGSSTERERAPVLTGPRPQSKIPTPSRRTSIGSNSSTPSNHHALALVPIASDSDAPAPNAHKTGFRRRQSKGLQNLSDSERVSKSPFIARHPNERQSSESGRGEDEWEESTAVPETSPSLGAVSEGEWVPPIPELEEREHDLPPIPQADIEQEPEWEQIPVQEEASPPPPPPKAPLHARLAAIATRAATPPRALSIDTTPVTSPTGPESPATPISAYKTPLSPPASNSKRQQSTPTPSSPTSPTKSPRRSSALAPSPTRSSLVSKRLLGPRSSPSPRASIGGDTSFGSASTSTPAGVNRSGSNPSKVIVRRGSGVNRRNSRVSRKSSGGRYIPLSRKGSRGANGKRRKTVTFDERCDVLEFDSGVGIDGEVWSGEEWEEEGGEVENGEWSFEEGKRREGSAEASPRQDGNPGGGKRYASPPMVPSGGWSGPVAWGASPAMSGYSPNGSFVGQFTPSNLGHFSQSGSDQFSNSQSSSGNFTPSPSTQHTYTPNMSMNGTPPPNANARYGNLGLGLGMGDAYGFGRQARVGSNGSMAGSGRRVSSGSNSGRPSGSGGAIASRIPGPGASSGAGQAGSTPGRAGSARSSLGRSESGSTGKAAFTPGRSAANSRVGGLSFAPGRSGRGGPGSTPGRVAGGVYGENARDSFGRTGRSRDSTSKVDESGASLPTRESTGTPPTQSSKENAGSSDILSALDSFDRSFPLENILDTAPLKVVNGSPGSDSDVPLMPASSKSADRSVDLENARRETEEARKEFEQARGRYGQTRRDSGHLMEEYDSSRELSRTRVNGKGEEESQYEELSEVVVQHSGAGVVVHHTGGTGAGVVVHHSGAGMVEGVFMHRGGDAADGTNTNISVEGIAVHHSGHSAVQVYDERSPDPSAGDLSLGAGGFSFASLMSFDSIISRGDGARLDDSQNASQRIDEEEEEDELPTNMRVLAGLDDSDLSIKVEETSVKVEEEEVDLSASPSRYGSALVPLPSIPGVEAMSPLMMDKSLSANSNSNSRLNVAASPRMDRPSPRTRFSDFGSPARPLSMARPLEPDFTGGSMNARSPRISRDDVLRRLMDKRNGPASPRGGSSTPTGRGSPTGLASPVGLASPGGRASPLRGESPAAEGRVARGPRMSETRIEIERLMTGVEHGFADASGEGESLGFHPGDESHSSLPYRRNATLEEEQEEEEEAEEIRPPPPAPEPELEPESEEEPEQEPEPEPEPAPAAPLRAPMQSTTNSVASGETETETEEAITPPMGRSFATGPGVGPRPFSLLSARPMSDSSRPVSFLDPGQPYSYFSEASSRPNSYMSASSGGEMSGKEKIRAHEEMILAKRRELRGGSSRPNRRRSKSTGDTLKIGEKPDLLDIPVDSAELELETSFNEQMRKIYNADEGRSYHIREADRTIYVDDKVAHHRRAGDVDNGKAWRTVRRPSDMNEYSREIKELRAQAGATKAHGKVFVKVRGLQKLCVPIPHQPTYFTCTLNNGIHFVTTPECRLEPNALIDQEFELIEHGKLEFTLTIKIRKDTHIVDQIRHMSAPSPTPIHMPVAPPPKHGGFRGFFSSTPKKHPKQALMRRPEVVMEDHLVRYMKADGAIGRAYVSFKDIVKRCDTRLFETSYPLIGEWAEDSVRSWAGAPGSVMSGPPSQRPVGELVLQIFRLPPLPGVPPETLPQSLEECHRGLRAVAWHKKIYHQGVLTQNGGDITSWRRRQLRVIGSNLVAYNDVTGKAIATIDLKRALAVEDDQQPLPPNSIPGRKPRDEGDILFMVERSFRLLFSNDEDIAFYADTDEEKAEWLRILRALVGNIPPHPLWAELVWQRHEQAAAVQAQLSQSSHAPPPPANLPAGQAPPAPPSKPEARVPVPRPQAYR